MRCLRRGIGRFSITNGSQHRTENAASRIAAAARAAPTALRRAPRGALSSSSIRVTQCFRRTPPRHCSRNGGRTLRRCFSHRASTETMPALRARTASPTSWRGHAAPHRPDRAEELAEPRAAARISAAGSAKHGAESAPPSTMSAAVAADRLSMPALEPRSDDNGENSQRQPGDGWGQSSFRFFWRGGSHGSISISDGAPVP